MINYMIEVIVLSEKVLCPICGEPTYMVYGKYPRKDKLCGKHATMLRDGEIAVTDKGIYYDTETKKVLNFVITSSSWAKDTKVNTEYDKSVQCVTNTNDDLTCIICGNVSDGKHFCKPCYFKYKDRSVDIRISHCNEVEILDEYGNLQYKCADGRKVRSRAEMIISDFLFNNRVRAVYEETIYYKDGDDDKTLHPDFYLPDYDIYIEYNELTNKPYLKSKDYAQKIYDRLQKKVFIMTEKDLTDIAACLKPKLGLH